MRIEFHPAAIAELLEAQNWYEERSSDAARSFVSEFEWALEKIQEAPERWRRHTAGTRRYYMPNFPFSIVYRVSSECIVVIAVAHHRRRPDYWQRRQ